MHECIRATPRWGGETVLQVGLHACLSAAFVRCSQQQPTTMAAAERIRTRAPAPSHVHANILNIHAVCVCVLRTRAHALGSRAVGPPGRSFIVWQTTHAPNRLQQTLTPPWTSAFGNNDTAGWRAGCGIPSCPNIYSMCVLSNVCCLFVCSHVCRLQTNALNQEGPEPSKTPTHTHQSLLLLLYSWCV